MNQQASDLPKSIQIIGRHRSLIGFVALLGALVGVVFAALNPPASSYADGEDGAGHVSGAAGYRRAWIRDW